MIGINVKDQVTPYIDNFLRTYPRFTSTLMSSLGWYVTRETKALLNNSSFTSRWKARVPLEIRRKLDSYAPKSWFGKMKRAIAYHFDYNGPPTTDIGWSSASAAMYGRIHEEGTRRTVTPFLRGYFARRGVPLSENKKYIKVPKRPIFADSMEIIEPKIGPYMEQKVVEYIAKNGVTKKVKTRKYEVFG